MWHDSEQYATETRSHGVYIAGVHWAVRILRIATQALLWEYLRSRPVSNTAGRSPSPLYLGNRVEGHFVTRQTDHARKTICNPLKLHCSCILRSQLIRSQLLDLFNISLNKVDQGQPGTPNRVTMRPSVTLVIFLGALTSQNSLSWSLGFVD